MLRLIPAFAAATMAFSAQAQDFTGGDAEAGERVFRRCAACHAVGEDAQNRVGPQLNQLFGRVPGSMEGFAYSSAMQEFGETHVWDAETLASFVQAPRDVVSGTKMAFPGLRKEQDVADLLAYLAQSDDEGFTVE
ncbi:c-type cytochrome [Palleronia sp.]|uniref:c-type cytochrome n=1 Tax=Palleronia sp. TaxID=1940284 RepID=UPI0035C7A36F